MTINTHRALFTYNRLPFGVSSAPAIFQRTMENLLQSLPRVAVYLDDIILTGRDEAEHLSTLDEVLRRLKDAGLRVRFYKMRWNTLVTKSMLKAYIPYRVR